jgi:hypothetical protein
VQVTEASNLQRDSTDEASSSALSPAAKIRYDKRWKLYTQQDRDVHKGLAHEDATNLAAHLVNAHGFFAAKYDQSKTPSGRVPHRTKWISNSDWVPLKSWTAWPLLPERVPRPQRQVWTSSLTKVEPWKPSAFLEEQLFGVMLKQARERWKLRTESIPSSLDIATNCEGFSELGLPSMPGGISRSQSPAKIMPPEARGTKRRSPFPDPQEHLDQPVMSDQESGMNSSSTTDLVGEPSKKRLKSKSTQEAPLASSEKAKATASIENPDDVVFSADDERSLHILKPIIRHHLSTLDKILTTLHKSRQGASRFGGAMSYTRAEAARRSKRGSRSTSAAPSRSSSEDRSDVASQPVPDDDVEMQTLGPAEEAEAEDGRLTDSMGAESNANLKPRASSRSTHARSERRKGPRHPRDWADVLGAAALSGVSPAVIERTAKRCAALFQEQMSFREITSDLPETGPSDEVNFTPQSLFTKPRDEEPKVPKGVSSRWAFPGSFKCPLPGCLFDARREGEFKQEHTLSECLKRHFSSKHHCTVEEMETKVRDICLTMEAGVQKDGYLGLVPIDVSSAD